MQKRAKILNAAEQQIAVAAILKGQNPERDLVIFLLSVKQGLRAAEIAATTWSRVTNADDTIGNTITVIGKGTKRREIPLHPDVKNALLSLRKLDVDDTYVVYSTYSRNRVMSANAVTLWFKRFYESVGFDGCSSHSGRRTTITSMAQVANLHGCSLRDVQVYAGHSRLDTTECYIDFSENLPALVAAI